MAITDQGEIAANAQIEACLSAEPSGTHTAGDAAYAALFTAVTCTPAVAGSGFTIYARSGEKLTGTFKARWGWSN